MSEDDGSPKPDEPRWRWFVAKRLDRQRHWVISTDARDDELDEVLREQGFDPTTRSEGHDREPPVDEREDTSLVGRRWVRIMCDYDADGVWNVAGESCLVDDLPISAPLRDRLLAWQDTYDDHDDLEGPFLDITPFAAEGLAIARAVKAELPDWTVVYHDVSKTGDYRGPRSVFEYEILLPETGA